MNIKFLLQYTIVKPFKNIFINVQTDNQTVVRTIPQHCGQGNYQVPQGMFAASSRHHLETYIRKEAKTSFLEFTIREAQDTTDDEVKEAIISPDVGKS